MVFGFIFYFLSFFWKGCFGGYVGIVGMQRGSDPIIPSVLADEVVLAVLLPNPTPTIAVAFRRVENVSTFGQCIYLVGVINSE